MSSLRLFTVNSNVICQILSRALTKRQALVEKRANSNIINEQFNNDIDVALNAETCNENCDCVNTARMWSMSTKRDNQT